MKLKYLANMEIDDTKLAHDIIKYRFGDEYQASPQFINFIKSMKFPNITVD